MGWNFFAIFFTGAFLSLNLHAYPTPVDFEGKLLRWNIESDATPITYDITRDVGEPSTFLTALVNQAAQIWSDIPTSYIRLSPASTGQGQITINFTSSLENGAFSAGYASFDQKDDDGPVHCQIEISTVGASIEGISKTILHELGHCLGLGHSLIPEAIMSYQLDKNRFGLDLDDIAAITRLYPTNGDPAVPIGCSILPKNRHAFLLNIFFLLLPIFVTSLCSFSCRKDQVT